MKTRINVWALIFVFVLLLTALILRNWKILVITIPLVAFLALTNFFLAKNHDIRVKRIINKELAYEGEMVSVKLELENRGPKLDCVEVLDKIPSNAKIENGSNHIVLNLEAGERREIEYVFSCSRIGVYSMGPVVIRNVNFLASYIEDSDHLIYTNFSVIPYLEEIKKIKISPKRTRLWLGNILSKRIGLGSEFYALDEYHTGDDLRKINWKASSRHDKLFVNQYEAEKSGDVILIIDARETASGPAHSPRSVLFYEIKAALSIAAMILHERNRIGLIVQRDVMSWITLGCGRMQFYKILHDLLRMKSSGSLPLEYTAWIIKNYFPPRTQIIIFSPLTDKSIIDYIIQLRAFKYDVLIISPSPYKIQKSLLPDDKFTDAAYKIIKFERESYLSELRQFANVIDWDVEEPIAQALRSVRPSVPSRV